jgi:hypothetical protein
MIYMIFISLYGSENFYKVVIEVFIAEHDLFW